MLESMRGWRTLWNGQRLWVVAGVLLVTHLLVLLDFPLWTKTLATLALTGWLPAALLLAWWLPSAPRVRPVLAEYWLYVAGAGYGVIVVVMLLLSYLPGPLTRWQVLVAFDLLIALLLVLPGVRRPTQGVISVEDKIPSRVPPLHNRFWLMSGLVLLALVGAVLRFPGLGYAEFQGDEARAMLRAAQVLEGDPNALLIHRKGPTEILLPAAIYVLAGRIDEATARFPFALANFAGLFALFLLGRRWFGDLAGWTAAMLLALDGYLIAFARIVQYQSVVFLTVVLTVLILQRLATQAHTQRHGLARYLLLAAFLLATGLLSHYEAILVALPAMVLFVSVWQRHRASGLSWLRFAGALLPALLLGGVLLAIFYVPFVMHPGFGRTYEYLAYKRIGEEWPYNNLRDFFMRSTLYSSSYAFLSMTLLTVIGLMARYRRGFPPLLTWISCLALLTGVALCFWNPAWLRLGGSDYTWLFFAVAFTTSFLMPDNHRDERAVWFWFGGVMVSSIFFVATPNTHVYNFYFAWTLAAGLAVQELWQTAQRWLTLRPLQFVTVPVVLGAILLFGFYEYRLFVYHEAELLRTWPDNRPRAYWTAYTMPIGSAIFGFPWRPGWKVVEALYAQGILEGAFETNTKDWIVDWYTRGRGSCDRDHKYYILADWVEPDKAQEFAALQAQVEQNYHLFGLVTVQAQPRLHIYRDKAWGAVPAPQTFEYNTQAAYFDTKLAGPALAQSGSVVNPQIAHPLRFRFGDGIWLIGYTLHKQRATPGGQSELTLYWQLEKPVDKHFTVFTQIINRTDARKAGQRDGEPVCNKYPTVDWQQGEVVADHYVIPIDPDAPPGTYSLLIGMYETATTINLPIFAADGAALGESLSIDEVYVANATALKKGADWDDADRVGTNPRSAQSKSAPL